MIRKRSEGVTKEDESQLGGLPDLVTEVSVPLNYNHVSSFQKNPVPISTWRSKKKKKSATHLFERPS